MKKFKKALASILAVAMLATNITVGFAATNFTDVDDTYSTAVNRLASVDILNGYNDGTFKPGNTITRAEAAAVMVRIMGKENLATNAAGLVQFSDMTAGKWDNGYVNVAASLGIVKGYTDGTFGPAKEVTYAEMVTMMVRALGAGSAVEASGKWPQNVLSFALIEGLTDDIAVVPNAPATRGDVALVANVTLDTPMWKATGYNTDGTATYEKTEGEDEETLFADKLELTKNENEVVDESLSVDEEEYSFSTDAADYTFAAGLEVSVLVGQEVDVWLNSDDEVVVVQAADDSEQEIVSFVDVTNRTADDVTVKLADGTEEEYDFAAGETYILNGAGSTNGAVDEDKDLSGKLILDADGDVEFLYVYDYATALVVDEVEYDEDDNTYTIEANTDLPNSDNDLTYDLDTTVVYVMDPAGNAKTLADVEEGDMLLYAGDDNEYVIVYPANTVEATVDSETAEEVELAGDDYTYSPNAEAALVDAVDVDDEVVAYLDTMGQIFMLEVVTGADTVGDYGIITDFYDLTDEREDVAVKINIFDLETGVETGLKVFDAETTDDEGEVFTDEDFYDEDNDEVNADDDLDVGGDGYAEYIGEVVRYEVTTDGIVLYAVEAEEIVDGVATDIDVSKEKFTVGGSNYYVQGSEVKVYQADELDGGILPVNTVDWDTLKDQEDVDVVMVSFDDDKEEAEYVFFNDDTDALVKTNDDYVGIISGVRELAGGDFKVSVVTKDGDMDFYVTDDEAEDVDATAFDGDTTLDLDNEDEWTRFVGLLVTFATDEDGYATDANIEFNNEVNVAKFYEITDRNEVKLLDNTDTEVELDEFADLYVLESDIAEAAAVKASIELTTDGGDVVTVEAATSGVAGNDLSIEIVLPVDDAAADALSATIADGVITVTLADDGADPDQLVNLENTATLVAAAIDALDEVSATVTTGDGSDPFIATDIVAEDNLEGGLDIEYTFDDVESADVSDIEELDAEEDDYSDAHDDEKSTVYYYVVDVDDDGELEAIGGSEAVAIMLVDPNEF